MQLLKLAYYALRHPRSAELGFITLGRALHKRANTMHCHWQEHHDCCRKMQRAWLQSIDHPIRRLLVLGAGELRDLDGKVLEAATEEILLVDADPVCRSSAVQTVASLGLKHRWVTTEITGVLTEWKARLSALPRRIEWDTALEALRTLRADRRTFPELVPVADSIISLNVLSQLPILWQDIAESFLQTRFGKKVVREREDAWIQAITPAAASLIEAHLDQLAATGARSILLITDVEYGYYRGERIYRGQYAESPPLRIHQRGNETQRSDKVVWKTALCDAAEVVPALYGVELNPQSQLERFPQHQGECLGTWLWHIQPQGIESKTSGIVHRVAAYRWSSLGQTEQR